MLAGLFSASWAQGAYRAINLRPVEASCMRGGTSTEVKGEIFKKPEGVHLAKEYHGMRLEPNRVAVEPFLGMHNSHHCLSVARGAIRCF